MPHPFAVIFSQARYHTSELSSLEIRESQHMGTTSLRLHVETVQYMHVTAMQVVFPHPGWQAVPSTF